MSCPTCDHTMERITHAGEPVQAVFWCPRCGTIRTRMDTMPAGESDDAVPKLVERCREFGKLQYLVPAPSEERTAIHRMRDEWKRLGIAESIHTESQRAK